MNRPLSHTALREECRTIIFLRKTQFSIVYFLSTIDPALFLMKSYNPPQKTSEVLPLPINNYYSFDLPDFSLLKRN